MTATIQIMPAATYHADPCSTPSLSSSIAQILINASPLHAYTAHPRLGNAPRDSARRAEIGSVAHKLALGAGAEVAILDFKDFRTNAAKDARALALSEGKLPILTEDYDAAKALAGPLAEAAQEYMGIPISDCLAERVIIWQEASGGWRRAMIDLMTPDYRTLLDLKTTEASAAPVACARRVYEGYQVQDAFYRRAADALEPAGMGLRRFGFIFAEQSAPYAVSPPIELSEAGQDLGRRQVERACKVWDECINSGHFPSYPRKAYTAEPPSWALTQEELV